MRAAIDPQVMHFVTWFVGSGGRFFRRIRVDPTSHSLVATSTIRQFEFAAAIPTQTVLSVETATSDATFPIECRVAPSNYAQPVPYWPKITRGDLALIVFIAKLMLEGLPVGPAAYVALLKTHEQGGFAREAAAFLQHPEADGIASLLSSSGSEGDIRDCLYRAYTVVRVHSVPIWSGRRRQGFHAELRGNLFGQAGGVGRGMVPLADLVPHSHDPNVVLGVPSQDMLQFLLAHHNLNPKLNYFVLQTSKQIEKGEELRLDKNVVHGFSDEEFESWFGQPYRVEGTSRHSIVAEDLF